jgi:hypothetical protein
MPRCRLLMKLALAHLGEFIGDIEEHAMGKVVELRRVDAEDRFRDRLATARAILRPIIDAEEVTEDVLTATEDLADDLLKAVEEFRNG